MFTCISERSFEPFTEPEARKIFKQLVEAVAFCHEKQVVHMDIKLDNIMYDEETEKITLIDFGLSDFIVDGDDSFFKRVGSYEYKAV